MLVKLDNFLQLFKVQIAKLQEYHLIPVQFCWESKLVPTPPLIKDLIKDLVAISSSNKKFHPRSELPRLGKS